MAIDSGFSEYGIYGFVPAVPAVLAIKYDHDYDVVPGTSLPRKVTLHQPEIAFRGNPSEEYVVIMVDPDLFKHDDPTGQVRHWMQTISFDESGRGVFGRELTSYLPCTPAAGTGRHRYIFVLAHGQDDDAVRSLSPQFNNSPKEDLKDRMGFYVKDYLREHGLTVVAANFMLVSADGKSTVQNVKAGAEAMYHKVVGR